MSNQNIGVAKVATIVGTPGMCSDDGRALTYGWRVFTNDFGGRGYYDEHYVSGQEADARKWVEDRGYAVQNVAWR